MSDLSEANLSDRGVYRLRIRGHISADWSAWFEGMTGTEHAHYTVRFTGRSAPTAAGIGTPVVFFTDDSGTYLTDTRDVEPTRLCELQSLADDMERFTAVCREHTIRLSSSRLDLPRTPPHTMEHNQWVSNAPGSTMLMPVGDASEQLLGLLAIFVGSGYFIVDDQAGQPAGDLAPFLRSRLLHETKAFPLSLLERITYEASCTELAFITHNMVLTMQAMGLAVMCRRNISTLTTTIETSHQAPILKHMRSTCSAGMALHPARPIAEGGTTPHLVARCPPPW